MVRLKKGPSQKPSIDEVARLAGVSIATVSRVINKAPSVKEANKQKVLEVIKELKYKPSVFAQRLASGKTNVIAFVIPRYEGIFYSFYALELLRGIGTLCGVFKLDLLLHLTDAKSPLSLTGVGGIIFADLIGNRKQLEAALNDNIPCVVINNYIQDLEVSCIAIDNLKGSMEAVNYLLSLGHTKIAHITGDLVTQAASQRLEGYKQALKNKGIDVPAEYIIKTDYSRGQARQAAQTLLHLQEPPTAVFVASDSMALEVISVFNEEDKKIPRDLSVVGFDDNPSGLYGPVALTTVRQPLIKMAEEAVKLLSQVMSGKDRSVKKVILPAELIIRETCRKLEGSGA
jgi:LacI family transcriptional regulator